MSFHDWELSGGLYPYDDSHEEREAEAEHYSPCSCGDSRCSLDDRDPTNVNVNGKWFTADCVGLCSHCGEVDDLSKLMRVGGGRFMHAHGCPDRVNEVRR